MIRIPYAFVVLSGIYACNYLGKFPAVAVSWWMSNERKFTMNNQLLSFQKDSQERSRIVENEGFVFLVQWLTNGSGDPIAGLTTVKHCIQVI